MFDIPSHVKGSVFILTSTVNHIEEVSLSDLTDDLPLTLHLINISKCEHPIPVAEEPILT